MCRVGWICVLLAVKTYENWGREPQETFSRLAPLLSASHRVSHLKAAADILVGLWPGLNINLFFLMLITDDSSPSCALCPEKALDPLCHHSITCKCGSDVTNQHNRLCNAILTACQRASLPARLEAGCGLGSDELRTRPADILVSRYPSILLLLTAK